MPTIKPKLSQVEMLMIQALADNNMNVSAAARQLFREDSGLTYRYKQIHKRTGLNPLNFYDLHELLDEGEVIPDDRAD